MASYIAGAVRLCRNGLHERVVGDRHRCRLCHNNARRARRKREREAMRPLLLLPRDYCPPIGSRARIYHDATRADLGRFITALQRHVLKVEYWRVLARTDVVMKPANWQRVCTGYASLALQLQALIALFELCQERGKKFLPAARLAQDLIDFEEN